MKFTAILAGLLLASPVYAAQESVPSIEATAPLEDLLQDQSFRKDYDNGLYDRRGGDFKLVSFSEYAYNPSDMSDYGLYVYVYNPDENKAVDLTSSLNSIQIKSNVFGGDDFDKYHLNFVSRNGDWFYKFKIDLSGIEFYQPIESRDYNVSGMELISPNDRLPTDYKIATDFVYTGYAEGIEGRKESDLSCSAAESEIIQLAVEGGVYHTDSSDKGIGYGYDLFYVYFSVPNETVANYGKLTSIKFEYLDCLFRDLMVITSTKGEISGTEYHSVANNRYRLMSPDNVSKVAVTNNYQNAGVATDLTFLCKYPILDTSTGQAVVPWDERKIFNTEAEDDSQAYVSRETLESRYYEAEDAGHHLYSTSTPIEKTLTEGDRQDLPAIGDQLSGWQRLWYHLIYGFDYDITESLNDIPVIEKLDSNSFDAASDFVDSKDEGHVKNFIAEAERSKQTPYMFRYAVHDYHWKYLGIAYGDMAFDCIGIRVEEIHASIGFDIIELGFTNELGTYTILPVVSNPINVFPDIYGPNYSDPYDWVRVILILIGVLIGLVVVIAVFEAVSKYRKEHPKKPKINEARKPEDAEDGNK